jgi:rhodanese-related sulfurtransferase
VNRRKRFLLFTIYHLPFTRFLLFISEVEGFLRMKHSEGFLNIVNDAKSRVREVTVADARGRLAANSGALLIDVREDNEWEAGHAAGAEHLGKGIIERDIEARVPEKETELILYCGGGYRSALAADALQKMGYGNVFSMAGGWKAWKEAGAPLEGEE